MLVRGPRASLGVATAAAPATEEKFVLVSRVVSPRCLHRSAHTHEETASERENNKVCFALEPRLPKFGELFHWWT